MEHMTKEEQQQLIKCLPSVDSTKTPERFVFLILRWLLYKPIRNSINSSFSTFVALEACFLVPSSWRTFLISSSFFKMEFSISPRLK